MFIYVLVSDLPSCSIQSSSGTMQQLQLNSSSESKLVAVKKFAVGFQTAELGKLFVKVYVLSKLVCL